MGLKYTFLEFSQKKLLAYKLELKEVCVLHWFVNYYFTNSVLKVHIKENTTLRDFALVKYADVIKQLPILGINNTKVVARYFDSLCEKGILEKRILRNINSKPGCYPVFYPYAHVFRELLDASEVPAAHLAFEPTKDVLEELAQERVLITSDTDKNQEFNFNSSTSAKEISHVTEKCHGDVSTSLKSAVGNGSTSLDSAKETSHVTEKCHGNFSTSPERPVESLSFKEEEVKEASTYKKIKTEIEESILSKISGLFEQFSQKIGIQLFEIQNNNTHVTEKCHGDVSTSLKSAVGNGSTSLDSAKETSHVTEKYHGDVSSSLKSAVGNDFTSSDSAVETFHATVKKDIADALTKIWGKNIFNENVLNRCKEFIIENFLSELVFEYLTFVKKRVDKVTRDNPRGYFYNIVFLDNIVTEFKDSLPPEIVTHICPVCEKEFTETKDYKCPVCELSVDNFGNKEILMFYKQFQKLSEDEKQEYNKEYFEILKEYKFKVPEEQFFALKKKYGITIKEDS